MVIELQRLRVQPELRGEWLAADAEVWTAGLSREPGFLGKEVWLGEGDEGDEILLVIRWQSRVDWEAMPEESQDRLDRAFRDRMPEGWEVLETRSYEVAG